MNRRDIKDDHQQRIIKLLKRRIPKAEQYLYKDLKDRIYVGVSDKYGKAMVRVGLQTNVIESEEYLSRYTWTEEIGQ